MESKVVNKIFQTLFVKKVYDENYIEPNNIYKVISYTDRPTITIENTKTGEREHIVVGCKMYEEDYIKFERKINK